MLRLRGFHYGVQCYPDTPKNNSNQISSKVTGLFGLYWGCTGENGKEMETAIVYWGCFLGYIGAILRIMERKWKLL